MTESIITEFSGAQRESISRIYRYSVSGVRVLDSHDVTRRIYRFDPSSNTMTENDPAQPGKILRRFVFDDYGMLEETFSFGQPPRTFRYEAGGRQIVMREGGDYGAVGKTFSFEGNGVAETAFGRNGSVERVYVFERGGEAITIRTGGWYGDVERRLVCERINAAVFREPEAFLQFLMFTEKSAREAEEEIDAQVAKIRGNSSGESGRSRFAYTGIRHTSDDIGRPDGITASRPSGRPTPRSDDRVRGSPVRHPAMQTDEPTEIGIDFIPDGDSSRQNTFRSNPAARERSDGIPLEERFQSAHQDKEEFARGESSRIPLEERFQSAQQDKEELTPGRSARISYEERKTGRRMP